MQFVDQCIKIKALIARASITRGRMNVPSRLPLLIKVVYLKILFCHKIYYLINLSQIDITHKLTPNNMKNESRWKCCKMQPRK